MFKKLILTCLIIGIAGIPPPAEAANCGPRDAVIESLKSKYAEHFTAGGLQQTRSAQSVMEIWSSPDTGTFTVLLTSPNGISCIVAAGTDFFEGPEISPVEGTAS
ncbi:hypothetical protein [uncultured Roseobacter sp.]|uniref:hypothetical protein n=1 Tax=uncultured Roseobacter sp. TaxID=114847 RepID=UPI002633104B|nr:hypothetical protein [uncultured Roseobacter sp.]